MLTLGSLFSGIGGFELGLERTGGFRTEWQVEIDPQCRTWLARHWPNSYQWDDVQTFEPCESQRVDVICGGFPCQDISLANHKGIGIEGKRSGLWSHYHRILRMVRPRFAIIENVAAIRVRGLDRVLWDLAEIGFDAEWKTLSAEELGAPQGRDRIFIVAYSDGERCKTYEVLKGRVFESGSQKQSNRLQEWPGHAQSSVTRNDRIRWIPDSELCRVAHGIPDELDRYRALGNAVVPQCAEWIGRRLLEAIGGDRCPS